jgi:hypothetical protein
MTVPADILIFSQVPQPNHNVPGRVGETQHILAIGVDPWLLGSLSPLCDALDIRLITSASPHEVPLALGRCRPIGVVAMIDGSDGGCFGALRSVSAFDADLPVLLVTGRDPAAEGMIDAAEQLWGLTNVNRIAETPGPREIMGFLFMAGRHSGTGRLLPLA